MNKKKIIILSLITLLLTIFTIIINITDNNKNILPKYLKSIGFSEIKGTTLYKKQITSTTEEENNKNIKNNIESEYEIHYFNTKKFEYTKNKITHKNNITKDYTPTYNYKNNIITYTYRIYYESTNIIFEGEYNIKNKKFTCTPTFYYLVNIENIKEEICNKIKTESEIFNNEISIFIKDPKTLKYINENIQKKIN